MIGKLGEETIACVGRREGVAPATWGQRYIWDIVKSLEPANEHLNASLVEPVPPGASLATVLRAVQNLVAEHDTFRTRYRLEQEDRLVQVLTARESFDVAIVEVDAPRTDDELREDLRDLIGERFPTDSGAQLRVAVVLWDGAPARVVLAVTHMALDHWSGCLAGQRLRRLMDGAAPGAAVAYQPFDQAEYEAGPEGRRQNEDALAYWRRSMKEFPSRYPGEQGREPDKPRYQTAVLHSPGLFGAARILARRARISPPTVLTAGFGMLLASATGMSRVPFQVRTNNRVRPAVTDSIGHFSQAAPLLVEVDGPFDQVLRNTHVAAMQAYYHGAVDPTDLARLVGPLEHGSDAPALTMGVNYTLAPTSTPEAVPADPTALGRSSFRWSGGRDEEFVTMYCDIVPAQHVVAILTDTTFIERDRLEQLLWQLEEHLIGKATHS